MADMNRLIGAASDQFITATATNATVTATLPAIVGKEYYLTAIEISASAAPAAAVSCTLKDGTGGTLIGQYELPASAFTPITINFNRPKKFTGGNAVEFIVPALGAAVKCSVNLCGFVTRQP